MTTTRPGDDDDWLADEADLSWDEVPSSERPPVAPPMGRLRAYTVGPRPASPATPRDLVLRRRAIGIVTIVVAIGVIVAVAYLGLSGGGGAPPAPTAPTVKPTAPAATPAAPAGKAARPVAGGLRVTLPASGLIAEGDHGAGVKALQRALARLGFSPGTADGYFGPQTLAAVLAFQRGHGLKIDGAVGSQTAKALNRALAA